MNHINVFILQWQISQTNEREIKFRAWGKSEDGQKICIHVGEFCPFLYIEPNESVYSMFSSIFSREAERRPISIESVELPKLYYASKSTHDMARCYFSSNIDFRYIASVFERRCYPGGNGKTYKVHETNVPPLLQFICERGLRTVGWHKFCGFKRRCEDFSTLADQEWDCLASGCSFNDQLDNLPEINIWSFDLEVFSSVETRMPRAEKETDAIIQISFVSTKGEKCLLALEPVIDVGNQIKCQFFKTETELIMGFSNFIKTNAIDLLLGYNILGFDFKYLIERSRSLRCFRALQECSLHKTQHSEVQQISWSSAAYRNQEFLFLPIEGIVLIDLLPLIRRDYSLSSYKLDAVVKHFIDQEAGKDNITPKFIFRAWRQQNLENLAQVGHYCIHDSDLVIQLFNKLQLLNSMIEMAAISFIGLFDIYARGQQLKVFSQIYHHCYKKRVIDRDNMKYDEGYVGARVFDAVPQLVEMPVSFDFESLYPSVIQSHNICYSTCVAEGDTRFDDSECHILEWFDHIGCDHDEKWKKKQKYSGRQLNLTASQRREREELAKYKPTIVICKKRKFRFLKTSEGVIPIIIKTLLEKRRAVKTEMKKLQPDTFEYMVLNARQLALKVSANSIYGFFGVARGYLPFLPAAMSITYLGRQTVLRAAEIISSQFGGRVIYGDTDSVYATFPAINGVENLWNWAKHVAEQVTQQFPRPLNLQFEESIYLKFLLLSKKRYVYQSCSKDGQPRPNLGKKGVLLVRRDNCQFVKNIYELLIKQIFCSATLSDCISSLTNAIICLIGGNVHLSELIISKSVGDCNDGFVSGETENGKIRVGDYIVPKMTSEKKMRSKGANNEEEFILLSLPPQIQLAHRMRRRGAIVENGSRLEYIVSDVANWNGKMGQKIEDAGFYQNNKWWLSLDYLYYIKSLSTPIDQLFFVVFGQDLVMTQIFNTCLLKYKLNCSLQNLWRPKICLK